MSLTPRFNFSTWEEGNTEPNLVFNELAYAVDAILQASVKDKDLATPPGAPTVGDAYIVAASPTGAWSGKAEDIAVAVTGGWVFYTPDEGWTTWVVDESKRYIFLTGAWSVDSSSTALSNPMNAAGDMIVGGSGGIPARLAKGADGTALIMAGGVQAYGTPATPVALQLAASDETTPITTGVAKVTFRSPYAFTLTSVRASLTTVSSSGIPTFDINVNGTTILSTKLTIDVSEKTSVAAAVPPVISSGMIASDDEITIDFDVAGTGATGVKISLIGTKS